MYDLIIIGGGPAGLSAGLYASRSGLNSFLIEKMGVGGQAVLTEKIENYPGFPSGIGGFELLNLMEDQAKKAGLKIKLDNVLSIKRMQDNSFIINCENENYNTRSVIIATGAVPRKLDIKGESEFTGKGVSYCAVCDAPFFKNKKVAVIGGSDSAVEEAIYLTKFAEKVYLIHRRDKLRASKIIQDRAFSNSKINFIWNSIPVEISGNNNVDSILISNVIDKNQEKIKIDGVFVFIGYEPDTEFVKDIIDRDKEGYIITDVNMKTNSNGIFAAGDCRKKPLKQVITACADGAIAGISAYNYLNS